MIETDFKVYSAVELTCGSLVRFFWLPNSRQIQPIGLSQCDTTRRTLRMSLWSSVVVAIDASVRGWSNSNMFTNESGNKDESACLCNKTIDTTKVIKTMVIKTILKSGVPIPPPDCPKRLVPFLQILPRFLFNVLIVNENILLLR